MTIGDANAEVDAVSQRALDATAVIIADDGYCSGTLLRSERHTVVLTASHFIKHGGPFSLLFNGASSLHGLAEHVPAPFARVAAAPRHIDVALAFLTDPLRAETAEWSLDAEVMDEGTLQPDDRYLVAGVSRQVSTTDTCVFHCHETRLLGHDKHHISVRWNTATVNQRTENATSLVDPSKPLPLRKPIGISGGALWRVRGSDAKIVGVCVGFREQAEHAVPASRWRTWVVEQLGG